MTPPALDPPVEEGSDNAAFPPGTLGLRTELGRWPDTTQRSLESAKSPIPAD